MREQLETFNGYYNGYLQDVQGMITGSIGEGREIGGCKRTKVNLEEFQTRTD